MAGKISQQVKRDYAVSVYLPGLGWQFVGARAWKQARREARVLIASVFDATPSRDPHP